MPKQKNPETGAQRNVIAGLTSASSLTAARLRFLLKPKEYGWAAASEAEALDIADEAFTNRA